MSEEREYSGTPLPAKLGIRAGQRLLTVDLAGRLAIGQLPPRVTVHRRPGRAAYDLVLVFCADSAALYRRFRPLAGR